MFSTLTIALPTNQGSLRIFYLTARYGDGTFEMHTIIQR